MPFYLDQYLIYARGGVIKFDPPYYGVIFYNRENLNYV